MWPLGNKADKTKLQGHKAVVIHGHRFVIRRVNPLLDFREDNMPQIFASMMGRRKVEPAAPNDKQVKRLADDMKNMIAAGLVTPVLVPVGQGEKKGHEDGITIDDIVRDEDTASKLYLEILAHSLNKFRGIKGVFFSLRLKYALWIYSQSVMGGFPTKSSSNQEVLA